MHAFIPVFTRSPTVTCANSQDLLFFYPSVGDFRRLKSQGVIPFLLFSSSSSLARWGNWKAVRNGPNAEIEICDLSQHFSENSNLAAIASEQVIRAEKIFREAHQSDPEWPLRTQAEAAEAAKRRKITVRVQQSVAGVL